MEVSIPLADVDCASFEVRKGEKDVWNFFSIVVSCACDIPGGRDISCVKCGIAETRPCVKCLVTTT